MMPNVLVSPNGKVVTQRSRISRTFDEDGSYKQLDLPTSETKMSVLGNVYLSEGAPGPVLEVSCRRRTGSEASLVTCMRKALERRYGDDAVGMGGTFLVKAGKIKVHVMPDYSECPINSDEDVVNWLKFYKMSSPFVGLTFLISKDPVGE